MAIRFHCKRCNQLLGIAARKAGTQIECPKCGISQIVPSEEAAAAALKIGSLGQQHEVPDEAADLVVYDDEPAAIESPRRQTTEQAAPSLASAPPLPPPPPSADRDAPAAPVPPEAPPVPDQPVPRGMILFGRRTVYVQAILFLVVAAVGFGAGYFIGRGDASFKLRIAHEEAGRERVLIEGKLIYDPGTGQFAGDEGAVIIALPEGKFPKQRLSISGIRPQDPSPRESNKTLRKITELGGGYCRADAAGAFSMVVPEQGKYQLLLISRNAARAKEADIDEADLREMEEFFQLAENLLSRYKYRWILEEMGVGTDPFDHNFGRDGQ